MTMIGWNEIQMELEKKLTYLLFSSQPIAAQRTASAWKRPSFSLRKTSRMLVLMRVFQNYLKMILCSCMQIMLHLTMLWFDVIKKCPKFSPLHRLPFSRCKNTSLWPDIDICENKYQSKMCSINKYIMLTTCMIQRTSYSQVIDTVLAYIVLDCFTVLIYFIFHP